MMGGEDRGELSERQLTLQKLDLAGQLLEVLLQTQVLLLDYFDPQPEIAVHVLLELGHLDALSLHHLQTFSNFS
jgi:hypothetical protein